MSHNFLDQAARREKEKGARRFWLSETGSLAVFMLLTLVMRHDSSNSLWQLGSIVLFVAAAITLIGSVVLRCCYRLPASRS